MYIGRKRKTVLSIVVVLTMMIASMMHSFEIYSQQNENSEPPISDSTSIPVNDSEINDAETDEAPVESMENAENTSGMTLGVPGNITATAGINEVKLVWEEVYNATGYEVEADDIIIDNSASITFHHTNLLPETEHKYRVRAKNEAYISNWSAEMAVSTLPDTTTLAMRGSGTPEDPYVITNSVQLNEIVNDLTAHYKLGADIDLENIAITPIGTSTNAPFKGSFDGNGYTISNLKISNSATNYVGFFGCINGATIKNVRIENVDVYGKSYVGGLVGYATGACSIENSSVAGTGSVRGTSYVGGLVGENSGSIRRCYATANVTATSTYAGGLIGYSAANTGETIAESYATGNVSGSAYVGGLIGYVVGGSGKVKTIKDCFALGNVTAGNTSSYCGGLVGNMGYTNVRNSYSAGKVNGNNNKGGLFGNLGTGATATSCYYDGKASVFTPSSSYDFSKLTSAMKVQATFAGWDYSEIWAIDEGSSYPYLKNAIKPDQVTVGLPEGEVAGGIGTAVDPYLINTADQLRNVQYDLTAHYKLGMDIDLEDIAAAPIGTSTNAPFKGSFDGNGYTISNLKISNSAANYIGFFGCINGATLKNVRIGNADVQGKSYVGGLVGYATGTCSIVNSSIEGVGNIKGTSYVGGLIGENSGSISRCYATANVTATSTYAGGLVGYSAANTGETISECYAAGNVSGSAYVGGLTGYIVGGSGKVKTISDCFALGNVTAGNTSSYCGGLAGTMGYTNVRNSYSAGKINGNNNTGGLFGNMGTGATATSCYYDGKASVFTPSSSYDFSKLTSAMKVQTTFAGWNFGDIWMIDEGSSYPYLRNGAKPDKVTEGLPEGEVAGGIGTAADPYLISTAEQLRNVQYDLTAHYKLTDNIDLENVAAAPIGISTSAPFKGSFDGNGYTISNLKISNSAANYIGFFGCINGATLKNVRIENADVYGKSYVGGLVGYATGTCVIENSSIEGVGNIKGTSYVGGLVGENSGLISRCYATANVTATSTYAGGLVGYSAANTGESISECYATGNVSGSAYVGGLTGYIVGGSGKVKTISDCFALGNVTAGNTSSYCGGLAGNMGYTNVRNSYSAGKVNGNNNTGGLFGNMGTGATATSCYYDGKASAFTPSSSYDFSKLTSAMKVQATFSGWNFSGIWAIDEGSSYPYLRNGAKPGGVTAGLPEGEVAGGIGTVADPYLISTAEQLRNVQYDLTAHYKLTNDIDLENVTATPIGTSTSAPFRGSFDGNGYMIKNLKISNSAANYIGFFGCINDAIIKNVRIENVDVYGKSYVGGLVGYATGACSIVNSSVSGIGNIRGTSYVGGLIGENSGSISRCYATANVTATSTYAGGLIGYSAANTGETISECYAAGNVSGSAYVGGLTGYIVGGSGKVKIISDCFALGNVTAGNTSSYCGGLAGNMGYTNVRNSYSAGKVNGNNNTGGLFGNMGTGATATSCYYDGKASAFTPSSSYDFSKLTSAMKVQATFTGWNFSDIWMIDEGSSYPYLKKEAKPDKVTAGLPEGEVAGGVGTTAEPYLISTVDQLRNIQYDLTAHYKVTNDIDLENITTTPIGISTSAPFRGSFDGNGYIISNLKISSPTANYIGFFGCINGATIKNVRIENADVQGKSYVGGLVGYATGACSIVNSSVSGIGNIRGTSYVGGLIGENSGSISRCYATANVTATSTYAGGLIGYSAANTGESISESYATGNVSGSAYVGGLTGYIIGGSGKVKTISDCFALGNVTAGNTSSYCGGLVGNMGYTNVRNSYSAGKVNGNNNKGGLSGNMGTGATATSSYFDRSITGFTTPAVQAKTTLELKQRSTYPDWDFTGIWNIYEEFSYPNLKNLINPFVEPPAAPSELTSADITKYSIGLEWDPMADADAYEIWADGVITNNGSSTSFLHSNLLPATQHTYKVRAKNSGGAGPWSNSINVTTLPEIPENITVSVGNSSITIIWDAVNGATGYDIEADGTVVDNGARTSYIHSSLQMESLHVYRVRAKNAGGNGEWSSPVEASTRADALAAPINILGIATWDNVTLLWDAVDDATGYDIEVDGKIISVGSGLAYEHIDLIPGTMHTYRIRAKNAEKYGDWSEIKSYNTPHEVLEIPQNIHATSSGSSIAVEWEDAYGADVYDIKADDKIIYNVQNATYLHSGLLPDTLHTYSIRARSVEGCSYWSEPITKFTGPDVPENITITSSGTSITLTWSAVDGAEGYDVEVLGSPVDNGNSTTYTHADINPNTQRTYRVRAKNQNGLGDWSPIAGATTLPGIPGNIRVNSTETTLKLRWDAVAGAAAYDVEVDGVIFEDIMLVEYDLSDLLPNSAHTFRIRSQNDDGSSGWSETVYGYTLPSVPAILSMVASDNSVKTTWESIYGAIGYDVEADGLLIDCGINNEYIHEGLLPNTKHIYRVRARSEYGTGNWSELIEKLTLPDIPQNLAAEATSSAVKLIWDAVDGATGYDIEADGMILDAGIDTVYLCENLTPNTEHVYRVRAESEAGAGNWSGPVKAFTLLGVPQNIRTFSGSSSIKMVWDEVYGVTAYEVEADGSLIDIGPNAEYIHSGLMPNTIHIYRTRAKHAGSAGEWSERAIANTLLASIADIKAISANTTITLTWTPVGDAESYDMEADGNIVTGILEPAYKLEGLLPNTAHTFKVMARSETNTSEWSQPLTKYTTPDIPGNIVINATTSAITVSWDAVDGAVGYDIEADGVVVENGANTAYVNSGLESNTQHIYRVRSKNEHENSEWSTETIGMTVPELTFTTTEATLFNFVIIGPKKEDATQRTITVTYNPDEVEVIDLCAATPTLDVTVGVIAGTNFEVKAFSDGNIVFSLQDSTKSIMNAIKFKAKTNTQAKITYVIE